MDGIATLDPGLKRQLETVWDYLAVSESPHCADVIFVFGSDDLAIPEHAAELYHKGHSRRVLVSGYFGRMTRNFFPKSESLVFKDRLVHAGVPASAILVEPKASNTLENVTFGVKTICQHHHKPRSVLLVSKGFVMRRCVATFEKQFSDIEACPCPPTGGLSNAVDREPFAFASRLVAELDRLDRYAALGHISQQFVPLSVRDAARRVKQRVGF